MEVLCSFREYVEHNPDLALGKGLIIDASNLYVSHQRVINCFVGHIDYSIRAAISYLDILVELGDEDEIVNRIFGDLLVLLTLEKLFNKPHERNFPILVYFFLDERP
jgi:hypothetical protein